MFENQQHEVESMMQSSSEFRRLYERHRELHKRVDAALNGAEPMDDLQLSRLKKEKLATKDRLTRLMEDYRPSS